MTGALGRSAGVPSFDALTLDIGGVFVVPRHDVLHDALAGAGVGVAVARFWDAHHLAMHAVDAEQSPAETFDADGSAERLLSEVGVCQVGEGPHVPVTAVIDSGAVGVAKPDPRIFHRGLEALGTERARTLHVGDSVHYDVRGATAAGMPAVHFDPRGLCRATDHPHVASLTDLLPG